jgi:glycosyltransferase involved in cell wall biosynthesis
MVQEPSVSVVITSHNFGDSVPEAIASVMNQTYDRVTGVYVIDDSSDEGDKTFEATQVYDGNPGPVVVYERVEYGNVAMARNRGIAMSGGKYVVSLDGDDWLREEWVADCVALLEEDATAGFAYGGSEVHILKDGKVQQVLVPPELSKEMGLPAHKPWPTEEHDKQFTVGKANQYPSGIMFRREALGLAGGYRPRYSPKGAGTEDAQLTLRLLSLGWTGRMTRPTHSNLWVHTHGQGHVSGDKEFKEVDWRAWLPWTQDYRFPFAAAATPKHLSHQVRSYEPDVSVIIPVGPGHETALINALDSLDAQQYRNWEAIVVFDGAHPQLPGMPPGDRGSSNGYWPDETAALRFIHAYPHVRVLTMSQTSSGASGPGAARNLGVQHARADYVTFLDADDYMSPQFLAQVNPQVSRTENAIVYGRYLSRMTRKQHEQFGGTVVRDEGDTLVVDFAFRPFDRAKAMARPEGERPYVWSGVNILLPKAWHEAIGGFDEDLESWEDCLYLLRLAWEGYSFHLVDQPLWVYSFVDGRRRRASHGSESELMAIFQEKYETAMASQYEKV